MRTLLLMHHAKSNWDDVTVPDHERPLSGRGRRAAPAMAEWMQSKDLIPDTVLCSTSVRTRQTWDLVERTLGGSPLVEYVEDLYLASPRHMLDVIRERGGEAETLMVIAHNPGTHDLAGALATRGPEKLLARLDQKFPTGALACFQVETSDWKRLGLHGPELVDFVRPKDLGNAGRRGL